MVSDRARTPEIVSFINLVRSENPDGAILIILDNARIHTAKATKMKAKELGIHLVYLPPYSPNLNPIEFGWKDLKRELSPILEFNSTLMKSREITLKPLADRKTTYTALWINSFIQVKG